MKDQTLYALNVTVEEMFLRGEAADRKVPDRTFHEVVTEEIEWSPGPPKHRVVDIDGPLPDSSG